ncbi:COG1361 S-layer family protein [Hominifimenecus sp. rT4P-3]|uniref:COG1361 S-layer family protein n=1 Tax=Hominifimenecus sp. rT4P-3 TaxID=3242979 RepID=UPI003DA648EA
MKRIGKYLLTAALCMGMMAVTLPVRAASVPADSGSTETGAAEGAEPGSGSEGEFGEQLTFSIDDKHRYEGMESSYQAGYLPTVENGTAVVILPLAADGEVKGNSLMVTPDLGSMEKSPFVYRNYQRTVTESAQADLDTGEVHSLYLVRLDLELTPERYNGVYPLTLNISAKDAHGQTVSQSFSTYVTITDGKSTQEPATEPPQVDEPKPESQPVVYVEKYTVTPGVVEAGTEFEIRASIKNTNKKQKLQNLVLTATTDAEGLTLLDDSNITFWEKLGKEESRELVLRYRSASSMAVGKYHVQLSISYDNKDAVTLSSSGTMDVFVTQPMRVEGTVPTIASSVNAGDTITLSFQAANLGKSAAYNVRFELDAAGLMPTGSAFIGNLESGSAGEAQMKVFVGAKNMNRDQEEEQYGQTGGTITLIYEDENGTEYTEESYFNTEIKELIISAGAEVPKEDDTKQGAWWISITAGAVVLAVLAGVFVWKKKKADREE